MDWDRSVFETKPVYTQRPRVDRFIAPRHCVSEMTRRWSWHACSNSDNDSDMWYFECQKQKQYKSYLRKTFGVKQNADRPQLWPCLPRERLCLSPADSILDLPNYSSAVFPELLDWSVSQNLVAALGTSYHMFSWVNQKVIIGGTTKNNIWSCKFDPRGDLLLLGTQNSSLELHNSAWRLCVEAGRCACLPDALCTLTALHWSPTGNSFVTGCSQGRVCTFDRTAKRIHEWHVGLRMPILFVRVSPNARYVAVVTVNSSFVALLTWPSLEYHLGMECTWHTIKTIAWHPWRAALLGIGAVGPNMSNKIFLWDAPSGVVRKTDFGHAPFVLDVMLFSHRTGEAVVSVWNADRSSDEQKSSTEILVMSGPRSIVDRSGQKNGLDRIRTMIFSPCGIKLATATVDEDLVIWNFLPVDYKYKNAKSRRFSALPVYLDQVTNGIVLR